MEILPVLTFIVSLLFFVLWLYVTFEEKKLLESIKNVVLSS